MGKDFTMSDETKVTEETTQNVETQPIDSEQLSASIVDKIKGLFTKKEPEVSETKQEVDEEKIKELAMQIAQEEINKIAGKTKKKETEKVQAELEAEKAKLAEQQKALDLEKQFISLGIAEEYQGFIKFELSKGEKSLEDFVKENPHFVKQNKGTTNVGTNIGLQVSQDVIDYLEFYRRNNQ